MKNCTVADYNGVTEKAEEMEQECFLKMAQELIPDEKNSGEEPQNKMETGQETMLFSGYR